MGHMGHGVKELELPSRRGDMGHLWDIWDIGRTTNDHSFAPILQDNLGSVKMKSNWARLNDSQIKLIS